jgi:predicted Holliday junction resolvase-like endonuclease
VESEKGKVESKDEDIFTQRRREHREKQVEREGLRAEEEQCKMKRICRTVFSLKLIT